MIVVPWSEVCLEILISCWSYCLSSFCGVLKSQEDQGDYVIDRTGGMFVYMQESRWANPLRLLYRAMPGIVHLDLLVANH